MAATAEKSKPQQQQQNTNWKQRQDEKKAQALTVTAPRLPFPVAEAEELGISPLLWRVAQDSIWPTAKTVDGILLALNWCRVRNLDPIKKPCHIVSIWNSQRGGEVESVWPSIAEVRITAHRTGEYVGCDETVFGPEVSQTFEGDVEEWRDNNKSNVHKKVALKFPAWAQMTVYRFKHGEPRKFVGPKVYFLAAYGCVGKTELPNEKWSEPGAQMLDKCSEAAALRKAFPEELGDVQIAEEMEGRRFVDMGGGISVAEPDEADKKRRPQRSDYTGSADATEVSQDDSTNQASAAEEEEAEGHELIDETGVVVAKIADDAAYCDAVIALFEKATEAKHLQTIASNNLADLDSLPKALGLKAREAFDAATERLSQTGKGKKAAKAEAKQAAAGKLSLKDARGKVVQTDLDPPVFIIEIAKLFDAADLKIDAEAIYKHNVDTIRSLSEVAQEAIVDAYDEKLVALGRG